MCDAEGEAQNKERKVKLLCDTFFIGRFLLLAPNYLTFLSAALHFNELCGYGFTFGLNFFMSAYRRICT